jgi:hypothetical protein
MATQSVADSVKSTVLNAAADSPLVSGLLAKTGFIDVQGLDRMLIKLSDGSNLDREVLDIKKDDRFAKVYDDIYAKSKIALEKGEFKELITALKDRPLSNGQKLDEATITNNLAKAIALTSTKEIQREMPSFWSSIGDGIARTWETAGKASNGSLIMQIVTFVTGLTDIKSTTEQVVKEQLEGKKTQLAMNVGRSLSEMGVVGSVRMGVMTTMIDQLAVEAGKPLTEAQRKTEVAKLEKEFPKALAAAERKAVGDAREQEVARRMGSAPTPPKENPNDNPISSFVKDKYRWLTKTGEYANAPEIKGHIYAADAAKELGIESFVGQMAIGLSTGVAITKKGELLALQEGLMKYNPNAKITFHNGKDGKAFDVAEGSYPETIIVAVAKDEKAPVNYYYFREPGASVHNVVEWALDGAKALLVSKGLGTVAASAPKVGGVFGSTAEGVTTLTRTGKAVNFASPVINNHALDTLSKFSSGQPYSDTDLGEAVWAGIGDSITSAALKGGYKAIPKEKIGAIYRATVNGKTFSNVDKHGMIEIVDQAGHSIKVPSEVALPVHKAIVQYIASNKIKTAAAGATAYAVTAPTFTSGQLPSPSTPSMGGAGTLGEQLIP